MIFDIPYKYFIKLSCHFMYYLYILLMCLILIQGKTSLATFSVFLENLSFDIITTHLNTQHLNDSPYEALYSSSQNILKIRSDKENCLTIRKETHDDANVVIKIGKHKESLPLMTDEEFLKIAQIYDISRRQNVKNKFANIIGLTSPVTEKRIIYSDLLPEDIPSWRMSSCSNLGGFSLDEINADKVMHMIPHEGCLFECNKYNYKNSVIYFCQNKASIVCIPRIFKPVNAYDESVRNIKSMQERKWHQYIVSKTKLKYNGAIDAVQLSLAEAGTGIGSLEGDIKFGKDKDTNFELKLQNINLGLMLSKEYEIRF